MGIKILGLIDKLTTKDGRVNQQAGDTDGIIASFYDLSGRPSLFLDGTQACLGNVGVKTATPNEVLTVAGNVSASGVVYSTTFQTHKLTLSGNKIATIDNSDILIGNNLIPTTNTFFIGSTANPVDGIYVSANSLYLGSSVAGLLGLGLSNVQNTLVVTGGLSASSMTLQEGLTAHNTIILGTLSATGLISQQKNHCIAALTSNQAMSGADIIIRFTDKDDPNNWWDATNYQFKPTVAGYYNIIVMVNWQGTNSEVQINNQIRKNANTIALSQMPIPKILTHSLLIQAITYMNGTSDYIDVTGYTGTNTDITGESAGTWTKFEAFKIS